MYIRNIPIKHTMYNQKIIPVLFRMTVVYRGSWRFVGGVIFNFSTLSGMAFAPNKSFLQIKHRWARHSGYSSFILCKGARCP
jgi:hypothetical protein